MIEEIKSKVNIIELAGQLGLNPTKNGFLKSIYKDEKIPSLKLYPKTNSFYDFSSGKGGDVINFYADYKKIDNKEAIKMLAREIGIDDGNGKTNPTLQNDDEKKIEQKEYTCILERQVEIYHSLEKYCGGVDEKCFQYLTGPNRGLNDDTIHKFRLFFVKDLDGTIDYLLNSFHLDELKATGLFNKDGRFVFSQPRLIIPYMDGDKIVYLRGRILPEYENNGMPKYIGLVGQTARRIFNLNCLENVNETGELLLCEGEFDTMRAIQQGIPAVAVPGVNNFPENGKELLEKYNIHLCFDNDEPGKKGMQEVTNRIGKVTKGLYLKDHKDLTDHLNNNGTVNLLTDERIEIREIEPEIIKKSKLKLITAREIQELDIPPIDWIVNELMPQGLNILAGRPKIGKSFFALNLAISIANGTKALGYFNTTKSKVLYIALEDNEGRIQNRINNIMGNEIDKRAPENLLYLKESFDFPKINDGGLEEIENILDDEKEMKLVIIDTLGRCIADKGRKDRNIYLADYEIASQLQKLAMKRNICILILHHTKKGSEENVFDEISGTTGLTGAMDTMMVIKEKDKEHTLHITGRDVEEESYKIVFDKTLCCWNVIEKKNEINLTAEREEIFDLIKTYNRAMRSGEIAEFIGKEKSNVSKLLKKLVRDKLLISPKYGYYELAKDYEDKKTKTEAGELFN